LTNLRPLTAALIDGSAFSEIGLLVFVANKTDVFNYEFLWLRKRRLCTSFLRRLPAFSLNPRNSEIVSK